MKVGTKSLLFGAHAFFWHPVVVLRAWRHLYRSWPCLEEFLAIVLHDIGYWGCDDMDGEFGRMHPIRGALVVAGFSRWLAKIRGADAAGRQAAFQRWFLFTVAHSSHFAKVCQIPPSKLCAADKLAICFEPEWFYLFRTWISGELAEYVSNGPAGFTSKQWFHWLRRKFYERYLPTEGN